MNERKIESLKRFIDDSSYTVAICGSGMMEEGGVSGLKSQEKAYEVEDKYGVSPEEIFTSSYYNTRPEKFFEFYKNEMLHKTPQVTESAYALAKMEQAGKLQCVITANLFGIGETAGIKNLIELHGSIKQNRCPRCGKYYPMEYVRDAKGVPLCESCKAVVRPQINLFGEMVDSTLIKRVTDEIEKAQTLLILGTTLKSEVYINYIRYFRGNHMVLIHETPHYDDHKADLVIIDKPMNILSKLDY